MRGEVSPQSSMFSYIDLEARISDTQRIDSALADLAPAFANMYSATGGPSIPPEQLIRADFLQAPLRTAINGTTGLRPDVPLVCGVGYG